MFDVVLRRSRGPWDDTPRDQMWRQYILEAPGTGQWFRLNARVIPDDRDERRAAVPRSGGWHTRLSLYDAEPGGGRLPGHTPPIHVASGLSLRRMLDIAGMRLAGPDTEGRLAVPWHDPVQPANSRDPVFRLQGGPSDGTIVMGTVLESHGRGEDDGSYMVLLRIVRDRKGGPSLSGRRYLDYPGVGLRTVGEALAFAGYRIAAPAAGAQAAEPPKTRMAQAMADAVRAKASARGAAAVRDGDTSPSPQAAPDGGGTVPDGNASPSPKAAPDGGGTVSDGDASPSPDAVPDGDASPSPDAVPDGGASPAGDAEDRPAFRNSGRAPLFVEPERSAEDHGMPGRRRAQAAGPSGGGGGPAPVLTPLDLLMDALHANRESFADIEVGTDAGLLGRPLKDGERPRILVWTHRRIYAGGYNEGSRFAFLSFPRNPPEPGD